MRSELNVESLLSALGDPLTWACVAGHRGLSRQVERPLVVAHAEDLRRARPDDLVVVPADILAEGQADSHLVAELAGAQVAGLVVGSSGLAIPEIIRTTADRLDLPVITVRDAELADVATVVFDALLSAQNQRTQRMVDVHQRFTRVVLSGGGLVEIATALHQQLACPVAIVDRDQRPLALVPSDAAEALSAAIADDAFVSREAIRIGTNDHGWVLVLRPRAELTVDDSVALERAALAAAMRQAQSSAVAEAEERFAALSLEELISGHVTSASEISERAASFAWDLQRPLAVLLASVDAPIDRRRLPTALSTIAAAARASLGPTAIVWSRSTTIAALVGVDGDDGDVAQRRHLADHLRRELDSRLRTATVSIGVGRVVNDPAQLASSYVEAARAVDVGRWARGRHVVEVFDDLGLERLLAALPTAELSEFVYDTIGALTEYDRANGSDLVDTLGVWLETRNMAEAARRMFVHYNTMKNRLERIETILGPVLTDATRALECEVSIHILRHYDVTTPGDSLG